MTVLVVDDEVKFAETLAKRIALRGFSVSIAHTGESALIKLGEQSFPVMLLDLRLPDIDGTDILRRVKGTYPLMEVIIITGHGSEQDREECLGLGAYAFLRKPIQFPELMELVFTIRGSWV